MPPVGITRTEFEYVRYLCAQFPQALLTVYDHASRSHLVLPHREAVEVLGLTAAFAEGAVCAESERALPAARGTVAANAGAAGRIRFRVEMGALLGGLAVLPPQSVAAHRLRRHIVHRLSGRGGWRSQGLRGRVERWLLAHPARAERLDFSRIDRYISVGCSWDRNDLEAIYRHKQRHGFRVTTCVYDLVPLVMPDVVGPGLKEQFPPYLCSLLWASDAVACISESTKRDLEAFIETSGAPRPALEVCRLGSAPDIRGADRRPGVADRLVGRPFALYVATYEPRKNHEFLHFLWNELVRRGNVAPIPLVLAGRPGWRTSELFERMRLNARLFPEHLVLAEGATDAEIAWLYRNSRFTVFPSLYEGWGLPVTESLFHGKFCVAADNSSLREAGQGLVRNIDLLDGREWLAEIERCICDDGYLRRREDQIARGFKVRSWEAAAADFVAFVRRTANLSRHSSRLPARAA
jgi:glycosyltransferase involved in cell wall biosynthesis